MIWIIELVVLLIFVAIGGFNGFIAWAILTALVLAGRFVNTQNHLKTIEVATRVDAAVKSAPTKPVAPALPRAAPDPEAPHMWRHERSETEGPPELRATQTWTLDLRAMTLRHASEVGLITSITGYLVRRISATEWQMKTDPEWREHHVRTLKAKLSADDLHEVDRSLLEHELETLTADPRWFPVPERFIAAIETRYQRYLIAPEATAASTETPAAREGPRCPHCGYVGTPGATRCGGCLKRF